MNGRNGARFLGSRGDRRSCLRSGRAIESGLPGIHLACRNCLPAAQAFASFEFPRGVREIDVGDLQGDPGLVGRESQVGFVEAQQRITLGDGVAWLGE